MSVDELNRKIAEELTGFSAAKDALDAVLASYRPADDTAARLVEEAECYGIDRAMELLERHPRHFYLDVAPHDARLNAVRDPLLRLAACSTRLDMLVAEREDRLAARDVSHQRVYMLMGREFVIDTVPGGFTMRFLDEAKPRPLVLEKVEPTHAPARDRRQDTIRDRDREP